MSGDLINVNNDRNPNIDSFNFNDMGTVLYESPKGEFIIRLGHVS